MSQERQYNVKSWSKNDQIRLREIVNQGMKINEEIKDLQEGLKETVKAVAEELSIKPAQISKAIKIAAKGNYHEEEDKLNEIFDILVAAGKLSDNDE
jgi:hypothetical protein